MRSVSREAGNGASRRLRMSRPAEKLGYSVAVEDERRAGGELFQ